MERNENGLLGDDSRPNSPFPDVGVGSILSLNLLLDCNGEVVLTQNSDGLSWKLVESEHCEEDRFCWGSKVDSKSETDVKFSDIYAVDFVDRGLAHESSSLASAGGHKLCQSSEMYHFTVHVVHKSKSHSSLWNPSVYSFGHKNSEICRTWVNQINSCINTEAKRPKSLLVFVHPRSGKGHGRRIWEAVAPLFSQAKVKTKVLMTERAGHARDVLASIMNKELSLWDGVVAVGGDGFFNEILNAILASRHQAPYPPAPEEYAHPAESECNISVHTPQRTISEPCNVNEDESPLLAELEQNVTHTPDLELDDTFSFPNDTFRFGIIPAGSTDAITICTTGARDPVTSALHIILGKKVRLDLARLVRWKTTPASNVEPCVRYAASFAGYGFYGDVITESEKYRWMGPKRYDYAGTKVFLQHKSYEAEVNYLEAEPETGSSSPDLDPQRGGRKRWRIGKKVNRVTCRANCSICNEKINDSEIESSSSAPNFEGMRWLKCEGRFLSIGGAVISCRNEKAPDGLVADAHLCDGFMHLILIKDCPHPFYLWHLIQLAKRGGNPLDFNFVEHHKTRAFTFKSMGKEGVWNVDGEIFTAHQLSAQVFRGLVSLFATGPDP